MFGLNSNEDKVAFGERFVRYYQTPIWKLIRGRLMIAFVFEKNDVDDLCQEVIIKLWSKIGLLDAGRAEPRFRPYMYTTCINCVRSYLKKRRQTAGNEPIVQDVAEAQRKSMIELRENNEKCISRLRKLFEEKEEDLELFIDHYIAEISIPELARLRGLKSQAIYYKLYVVREKAENDSVLKTLWSYEHDARL